MPVKNSLLHEAYLSANSISSNWIELKIEYKHERTHYTLKLLVFHLIQIDSFPLEFSSGETRKSISHLMGFGVPENSILLASLNQKMKMSWFLDILENIYNKILN